MVLWDRTTGLPVGPLITWQDGRGVELAEQLVASGVADTVRRISGLPLDPMFSALKARWLLDAHDPDRRRSRRGELCLGTVDSWLLSTDGHHIVEVGNASRTQLLDLNTGDWSPELLDIFEVPAAALPEVLPSDGTFPGTRDLAPVPDGVPIGAVLGDSHAALFGHGVREPGVVKATYGTGTSVMGLVEMDQAGSTGLCRTIAWQRGDDGNLATGPRYALEGNIRSSGSTLAWLAGVLEMSPAELAALAEATDNDGVHLVPAFSGLAAPWWDPSAVGVISGLTLGTGRAQLARAALESIAHQVADVVSAARVSGVRIDHLLADGGASVNDALMRLQADLAGLEVQRSAALDVSAIGAAHLAGLTVGLWDEPALAAQTEHRASFHPRANPAQREAALAGWRDAICRARGLAVDPRPEPTRPSETSQSASV
jgi:glycerol kinase